MSRGLRAALIAALACLPACGARRPAPLTPPALPYEHPLSGPRAGRGPLELERFQVGWDRFERGDLAGAAAIFEELHRRNAAEPAYLVALSQVELNRGRAGAAARYGERALELDPNYPQAALCAARALGRAGDPVAALARYDLARRFYAERGDIAAEAESLRAQAVAEQLDRAQAARARGSIDLAVEALRTAGELAPQSAVPFRALGELLLESGDRSGAAAALERAARLGGDPALFQLLADTYRALGQPARAAEWERRALGSTAPSLVPSPELARIAEQPLLARGDLARLLVGRMSFVERLGPLARPPVLTDLAGSGAERECIVSAALGLMDPAPNHTFLPAEPVRRDDLAVTLDRLLDLYRRYGAAVREPAELPAIADLHPSHRHAKAIRRCVGLGLLALDPAGNFRGGSEVRGREGWDALERLLVLVGPGARN